jgi:UDP-3-O-[3-hydroxymyristoyl] glucosamine N-acyltransferase
LTLFYTQPHPALGVMPEAVIGTNVVLGEDISIYPGAVVGNNVVIGDRVVIHPGAVMYDGAVIGDDCVIHANAVVRERCRLGKRCKLQPGAVIGSDGFGYAPDGQILLPDSPDRHCGAWKMMLKSVPMPRLTGQPLR